MLLVSWIVQTPSGNCMKLWKLGPDQSPQNDDLRGRQATSFSLTFGMASLQNL